MLVKQILKQRKEHKFTEIGSIDVLEIRVLPYMVDVIEMLVDESDTYSLHELIENIEDTLRHEDYLQYVNTAETATIKHHLEQLLNELIQTKDIGIVKIIY